MNWMKLLNYSVLILLNHWIMYLIGIVLLIQVKELIMILYVGI